MPVNRQAARLGHRGELQAPQHREHARIHRVAAQLVTGKSRAIDQRDARARAREDGARRPNQPVRRRR